MLKVTFYALVLCSLSISAVAAGPIGEMHINAGAIEPQGNYSRYTDLGPTANMRFTFHIPRFRAVSGWANVNGSFFTSEKSYVQVFGDPYVSGADQTVSEYAIAIHAGAQLGSDSRSGFFRPFAGIGPGLYFFNTQTVLDVPYMEEHYYEDNQTQVKFGWHGMLGTDLYFTPKWGLSIEFSYDHVLNLDHVYEYGSGRNLVETSRTARYFSFLVGVSLPFKTLE